MSDTSKKITVLIADDQALIRTGLETILSVYDDIEVVGLAQDGQDALSMCADLHPQVLMMDIRMPNLDGIAATKQIKNSEDEQICATCVLIMTTFDLDEYVYEALRAGASGFILKDAAPDDIANAIRVVAKGDSLVEPSVLKRLVAKFVDVGKDKDPAAPKKPIDILTERENEILFLIADGLDNNQISEKLFISPKTCKTHVANIMAKTDCHSRAALIVYLNNHQ